MSIVLASASPYRGDLLSRLELPFVQSAADIDESPLPGESAAGLATRLAAAKARALGPRHPAAILIGSDQTLDCEGILLGKPGDFETARRQLRRLSGRRADFYTAVTLLDTATGRELSDLAVTVVHFRALTEAEIERYLRRETPYDCAGSFRAEGLGISLFEAVHSDDPTALIGLPLIRLRRLLAACGVAVP
ncbi:MAG: Maf family protein [Pseudomonadota bacterium]|jgi:septum formation protein